MTNEELPDKHTAKVSPEYWAHTPSKKNPHWNPLTRHILRVTEKAVEFAQELDATDINIPVAPVWAHYLGLLHDLGKFTDKFQKYLLACYLADKGQGQRPKPGSAPHKQHGTLAAWNDLKPLGGANFAIPIFGHHGGMETPSDTYRKASAKTNSTEVTALRSLATSVDARLSAKVPDLSGLSQTPHAQSSRAAEMFLRFLFSCLTDADSLDAEAHKNPDDSERREVTPLSMDVLRDRLRARQENDFAGVHETDVNKVRREVYDMCRGAACDFSPGVFQLCVPTGGGKTRSSLAFALEHAASHGLRRVIYAIPYTSIVDQTAKVFRGLFTGAPGTVLEHHSAIEPKKPKKEEDDEDGSEGELWRRLAAQNWDAPLIVTTNVQLFESLFSNRPSACRKVHRLARAVIVLDEVQTLPPTLLTPLLDGLKTLADNFGATIVLCTATQPAFQGNVSPYLEGFSSVQSIIPDADRDRHFQKLQRVRYQYEPQTWTWEEVSSKMRETDSCLCIVNTRRQARRLMDLLDPERKDRHVLHLSTLMCGKHRRRVLRKIRLCLRWNIPIKVVSTTVVECGVDLDFPLVLRAIGPLHSIVQAAGRCNREGKRSRKDSKVIIFTPEDGAMPGDLYKTAVALTEKLLKDILAKGEELNLDDPKQMTRFFARFYSLLETDTDAKKVQERCEKFDYLEVAKRVRLIEDDTVSVLVHQYAPDAADAILNEADAIGGMTRKLWRQAQPLCVSLDRTGAESGKLGVDPIPGGLYVWYGDYDDKTGIPLPQDMADGPVYRSGELIV